MYSAVPKTAQKRGGISWIWQYGTELRRQGIKKPDWLCNACWDKRSLIIEGTSTTSRAIDHLEEYHSFDREGNIITPKAVSVLEQQRRGATEIGSLVTHVDLTLFKHLLITWIVIAHLALSLVEVDEFRALIQLLNPGIYEFLYKSGNTIRKLIMDEFEVRKDVVRKELAYALSKIHISFDLWISPGQKDLIGVVAHYLLKNLQAQSLLIALREMDGSHSSENIAAVILPVFADFCIEGNIGYFISDNMTSNDRAVDALYRELRLPNPTSRRLKYIGHVINLSAKAFLYSKEEGSFDFEISELAKMKFEIR